MTHGHEVSASLEDYLEAILHIVDAKQVARARDIVDRLGVHNSSVTQALRVLSEKGLVNYIPYDAVTLTDDGRRIACDVAQRHQALRQFLVEVLGIPLERAEVEACRLEHAVSGQVTRRIMKLLAFQRENPQVSCRWDDDSGGFQSAAGE